MPGPARAGWRTIVAAPAAATSLAH
jgi:hypothetical protein